jgi:hypothetical protein
MFPEAIPIRVSIGDSYHKVLSQIRGDSAWFAFHINLTNTGGIPRGRQEFCECLRERGIRVVNGHVTTISKNAIQDACAEAGLPSTRAAAHGDPDEILILKSNCNYGGEHERELTHRQRRELGLTGQPAWTAGHDGYLVLPRRRIDMNRWNAADIILERYITNQRNFFYRGYVFFDRLVISRVIDPAPLKKMPIGIPRESWFLRLPGTISQSGKNPPMHVARSLAVFCAHFKLDFGALDVVEDEYGECYIIDVNTTPYWGNGGHPDLISFLARHSAAHDA